MMSLRLSNTDGGVAREVVMGRVRENRMHDAYTRTINENQGASRAKSRLALLVSHEDYEDDMPKLLLNKQEIKELENRLQFDAIDNAKKLLGENGSVDGVNAVTVMLFTNNNARKAELLQASRDSTFSMDTADYIAVIEEEGFIQVLDLDIPAYGEDDRRVEDNHFYIYFKADEGLLLTFDTYWGQRNAGNVYFNWQPKEGVGAYRHNFSSGNGGSELQSGYLDCREAIRLMLRNMRKDGTFLPVWERTPRMWLIHHGDMRSEHHPTVGYSVLMDQRLAMLPAFVQRAIGFNPDAAGTEIADAA
jgi:hypothetical protein